MHQRALDADASQHASSRALLEAARHGSTTLYVTSQILSEFYSIVTNARRVSKPRSPEDASSTVSDLLAFLHVLPIPAHTVEGWLGLLRRVLSQISLVREFNPASGVAYPASE
jgi:predicted nucleic acid-binding protein